MCSSEIVASYLEIFLTWNKESTLCLNVAWRQSLWMCSSLELLSKLWRVNMFFSAFWSKYWLSWIVMSWIVFQLQAFVHICISRLYKKKKHLEHLLRSGTLWCLGRCCSVTCHVQLFANPWTAAHQASLSSTISWSLLKFMSIELVMLSNHLILCCPLLLLPLIFPSIKGFSSGSVLRLRWPKYWNLSFSISPSNEYSGLISFRTGLIPLQSKGLSRVLSSTTVEKHQFFSTQPSLWFSSHIRTWLLEKPYLWPYGPLLA